MASHHSAPQYRELMSAWSHPKWHNNRGWGKGGKQPAPPKDKNKDKVALPSYDGLSLSSSSTNAAKPTVEKEKDMDLKNALKEFIAQNSFEVPAALKEFVQTDVGHSLKEDQRQLNQKRKLVQKVERLKAAQKKKEEQWSTFKQQVKEHVTKEKARYETECQEIAEALKATQLELDKAMTGEVEIPADMETETADTDVDEIFKEDTFAKDKPMDRDQQKDATMAEAIMQTQAGQMMLTEQLTMLQNQVSYMASVLQAPAVPSPTRQTLGAGTPTPSTPNPGKKRNALEPFARATSGPYSTPDKEAKNVIALDGLDGYGPA